MSDGFAAAPPQPTGPPQPVGPPVAWEFRPGIIALRPLQLGDLYGGVIKAVRGNVAATIGLAFVTTLVFVLPLTLFGSWLASLEDFSTFDETDGGTGGLLALLGSNLPTIAGLFAPILLTGFIGYVIGQAVLGRKVTAAETWDGTKGRLLAVFGATVLTILGVTMIIGVVVALPITAMVVTGSDSGILWGLTIFVVFVAAVALTALFVTRLAFVTSAIVLERVGVLDGIRRSWQLSARSFWRIFGIRLLTSIIIGTAGAILTTPIQLALTFGPIALGEEERMFMWIAVSNGITTLITLALTTPFSAGVDALLYIDRRIRREGLDVQLIQTTQQGVPAPWTSATPG